MDGERGQATVEWTALVLVVGLAFAVVIAVVPRVDGRSFGAWLAHEMVCAVRGGCDDGDAELAAAYGGEDAELVRRLAPGIVYEPGTLTLPVDFRECRDHACSDARDDRDLDVHAALRGGARATVFTHVVRSGGEVFVQYWLYYPDSTTTALGAAGAWRRAAEAKARLGLRPNGYPADHQDDWESYQVRIDARGRVAARASSHRGYQYCKQARCTNRWGAATGWTRVSRGSHAGHLPLRSQRVGSPLATEGWGGRRTYRDEPQYPGVDLRERTTTPAGVRLVPLERVDPRTYRPLNPGITPPWGKRVFREPLSDSTS